jgi:8-oxo-dGTP pyrophosphatase MutT (NUDIX family)
MRTLNRDIISGVIFSKDGKIFQALRSLTNGGVYPGYWGIVGGGMEIGETHEDTLFREIQEEMGNDLSKYPIELIDEAEGESEKTLKESGEVVLCKMKFYTYRVLVSDKIADEIRVTLNNEHTEYRWSEVSDLKSLKLTPPSVELFRKLGYL